MADNNSDDRHVCPVWVGYLMASPLRRLLENPEKILSPYVKEGMKALDFGCAMGFFSLPLARMVGPTGRVVCVDLQEKMIKSLNKRASRAGLSGIIETRVCPKHSTGLDDISGEIDFALLMAVVHEVTDSEVLFSGIHKSLKQGGKVLIAEPKRHVSRDKFRESISIAQRIGFEVIEHPEIKRSFAVLMSKVPGKS
ncbi:MAG: methyltransferase domain-containing protein [Candidatus Aminicenantes bacterium]|nr:methyltransferase domain-containing protein [Candidatus Aminicenantes bacterium]NIM82322.1 methyltransferase domain-containing protein [Candidatus Aminicenantes bacterium]NIN21705.1 methyltransferase domain-containing protein [Candidatus Aminicenantes bacterium]NIN45514.1 methyltransferase domain-containing protein [Candidatus Aminicenantes bacterium]NIN88345.1 methyltransferase domain-containing protein [Candidatus Aminicenantes bacterium]